MRTIAIQLLLHGLVVFFAAAPATAQDDAQKAKDALIVRTLLRLPGIDLSAKPEAKAALLRHLETLKGTDEYLDIAGKFQLQETKDELLRLAIDQGDSSLGVKAAGLLVKFGEQGLIAKAIADPDPAKAAKFIAC